MRVAVGCVIVIVQLPGATTCKHRAVDLSGADPSTRSTLRLAQDVRRAGVLLTSHPCLFPGVELRHGQVHLVQAPDTLDAVNNLGAVWKASTCHPCACHNSCAFDHLVGPYGFNTQGLPRAPVMHALAVCFAVVCGRRRASSKKRRNASGTRTRGARKPRGRQQLLVPSFVCGRIWQVLIRWPVLGLGQKPKETLGPKHPDTLTSLNNLACTVDELGNAKEAGKLYQQCLETRRTILGPSHPDTMTSMSSPAAFVCRPAQGFSRPVPLGGWCSLQGNLALFLRANGQRLEAEALLAKVLDGRRKIFGIKHPDTIISMNNCAAIARDARHKSSIAYIEILAHPKVRHISSQLRMRFRSLEAMGGKVSAAATVPAENEDFRESNDTLELKKAFEKAHVLLREAASRSPKLYCVLSP